MFANLFFFYDDSNSNESDSLEAFFRDNSYDFTRNTKGDAESLDRF